MLTMLEFVKTEYEVNKNAQGIVQVNKLLLTAKEEEELKKEKQKFMDDYWGKKKGRKEERSLQPPQASVNLIKRTMTSPEILLQEKKLKLILLKRKRMLSRRELNVILVNRVIAHLYDKSCL